MGGVPIFHLIVDCTATSPLLFPRYIPLGRIPPSFSRSHRLAICHPRRYETPAATSKRKSCRSPEVSLRPSEALLDDDDEPGARRLLGQLLQHDGSSSPDVVGGKLTHVQYRVLLRELR